MSKISILVSLELEPPWWGQDWGTKLTCRDLEEYDEDTKKYIEDKEEQNMDMVNKDEESKPIDQEPDWERPADHPELYDLNR